MADPNTVEGEGGGTLGFLPVIVPLRMKLNATLSRSEKMEPNMKKRKTTAAHVSP
jgi:hypothetical protein